MKNKIITIIFILIIFSFLIAFILIPDIQISTYERRKLASFPKKFDTDFSENLDNYIIDQFPLRKEFINLNSQITRNIFGIKDNNDVYVVNDVIYDMEYPLDIKQANNFTNKINYIIENNLKNSNVYYSVIPDKSYFLAENEYLKLDYDLLYQITNKINAKYIDVKSVLTLEDYYRTDIHWKQENLGKVAKLIIEEMDDNFNDTTYQIKSYNDFYGSSYSKASGNIKPDTLVYLYNKEMENLTVKHLEYGEKNIYDEEKLTGIDSYDVFLSGASSYIEIENNKYIGNKELVIFRDSFASSLIPLLTEYYSKITVIDLRYISFNIVKQNLNFENKDILFLYSVPIINNSSILKI